jgi:hypothetical protein
MSQPDDIDKLLREIDAMNRPTGTGDVAVPGDKRAAKPEGQIEERGRRTPAPRPTWGGRLAWTGAGAVGGLLLGVLLMILPLVGLQAAVGAALGGALMAFLSGPPRWFDDGQ